MDKKGFKIGDTVKLKAPYYCGINSSATGRVVGIRGFYVEVSWDGELRRRLGKWYPHKPSEIEHAVKVGEQLLFSFMNEGN